MKGWIYENDEDGIAYPFAESCDNWLIRDMDTDNRDVVATVQKVGDEEYDNAVTFPNVVILAAAPRMLRAIQRFLASSDPSEHHNSMVELEEAAAEATRLVPIGR